MNQTHEILDGIKQKADRNEDIQVLVHGIVDGRTFLDAAIKNGRIDVVESLVKIGALENPECRPLFNACLHQQIGIVRYLFDVEYTPNDQVENLETLLITAASAPREPVSMSLIRLLIDKGAPVSKMAIEVAEISPNYNPGLISFLKEQRSVDHSFANYSSSNLSSGQTSQGCFIATACYTSYDHPTVLYLRRFRDERLSKTVLGRSFVRLYYRFSPFWANLIAKSQIAQEGVKMIFIRPMIACIKVFRII